MSITPGIIFVPILQKGRRPGGRLPFLALPRENRRGTIPGGRFLAAYPAALNFIQPQEAFSALKSSSAASYSADFFLSVSNFPLLARILT